MKKTITKQAKATLLIIAFISLISFNLKSQSRYTIPSDFTMVKDYNGDLTRNDNDFDNDGITDLAIVCTDKNESKVVIVFLSTKYIANGVYSWFPWNYESINFKYANNVLDISGNDFGGFEYVQLKLKYYSNVENMKLIGYANESNIRTPEGGLTNIAKKNINLNTGEYEIGGVKRKVTIDLITLSNIEKYFEYLSSIGENYQK